MDKENESETEKMINDITIELMIKNNPKYGNKYLNPSKLREKEELYDKIKICKKDLITLFLELVENPQIKINSELNEIFEDFVKTAFRHFDADVYQYDEDYEDEKMDFSDIPVKSYWGPRIKKI